MSVVVKVSLAAAMLASFAGSCATAPSSPPGPPRAAAEGCADGARDELFDGTTFPDVAACAGTWADSVDRAAGLCAPGWHVCTGVEPAIKALRFGQMVTAPGCYAFDAAQDNDVCHPGCMAAVAAGIDSAKGIDMAGIGKNCRRQIPGRAGCIAGGRIDASENSGTGCGFNASLSGVVCCRQPPG
jgi:hypothetical protein